MDQLNVSSGFPRFYNNIPFRKLIFIAALLLCLSPLITPPIALLLGILLAQFVGHPFPQLNHKATQLLLQISVVELGFGMNVETALKAGKIGILFTIVSIFGTLILGLLLGRIFRINKKISFLISSGTAICGGSAIAAISPIIRSVEKQTSVALGTVFILNSAALFIFPFVGRHMHLSQTQFGLWSAIAIHDTSSVVGAASKYGNKALEIATTVKLARALWIVPIAFFSSLLFKARDTKIKIPYFIGGFVLAILLNTYLPFLQPFDHSIVFLAKTGLTLTLFLIGSGLSKETLASVGFKPVLQGVILWSVISVSSLLVILHL